MHTSVYIAHAWAHLLLVEQGWFCHNASTVDFQEKNIPAKRGFKNKKIQKSVYVNQDGLI